MSFRIGLIGVDTTHAKAFMQALNRLNNEKAIDVTFEAVLNFTVLHDLEYINNLAEEFKIAKVVDTIEEMSELVDGVLITTINWEEHIKELMPLIEKGKKIFLDKPMLGSYKDIKTIQALISQGKLITGGSSLRFANEAIEVKESLEASNSKFDTIFIASGVDEFFYGIHNYTLSTLFLGKDIDTVQTIESGKVKRVIIRNKVGSMAVLHIEEGSFIPFNFTGVAGNKFIHKMIDAPELYYSMFKNIMPYFIGETQINPIDADELFLPELLALAALKSSEAKGAIVDFNSLSVEDISFNGKLFEQVYIDRKKIK